MDYIECIIGIIYGISFLALVGTFVVGCQKENLKPAQQYQKQQKQQQIILTEENFQEFIANVNEKIETNAEFIDSFIKKSDDNTLDKETMLKMLELLNFTGNINVEHLDKANQLSGVYDLLDKKNYNPSKVDCNKLVEIRDAMLDECDKYVIGIDEACGTAVMIAYWWKSRNC